MKQVTRTLRNPWNAWNLGVELSEICYISMSCQLFQFQQCRKPNNPSVLSCFMQEVPEYAWHHGVCDGVVCFRVWLALIEGGICPLSVPPYAWGILACSHADMDAPAGLSSVSDTELHWMSCTELPHNCLRQLLNVNHSQPYLYTPGCSWY